MTSLLTTGLGTTDIALTLIQETAPARFDTWLLTTNAIADVDLSIGFSYREDDYSKSFVYPWHLTVPAAAGQGTVAVVDVLAAILPAGFHSLLLPIRTGLAFKADAAMETGETVFCWIEGGAL